MIEHDEATCLWCARAARVGVDGYWCATCSVHHDWSGFSHEDWSRLCTCGCRCPERADLRQWERR
jgi:hypothetical protein